MNQRSEVRGQRSDVGGRRSEGQTTAREKALSTDLMEVMRDTNEFIIQGRVGNIQINMFKGGITNWVITETKKGQ